MRLFIIGIKYPPETFIVRKIQGLKASGVDVTICTNTVVRDAQSLLPHVNILQLGEQRRWYKYFFNLRTLLCKLIFHPLQTQRAWGVARKNNKLSEQTVKIFVQLLPFIGIKPDIIHFEWNSTAIQYQALFDFIDCPFVVSCRGSQVQVAPYNPKRTDIIDGLRITFAKAAAVHCVSEAICNEAMKYGLDRAKARIIRPAVDPDFFEPDARRELENTTCRIVTTGSLIWRKGYEYSLLALQILKQRGYAFSFEIIGDGVERQRILYTVIDLGLEAEVKLTGKLEPQAVKVALQNTDIFLLSSLSEGISNAVLEAMACGLPIVTTNCGGMSEAVTNGIEGFVVPVRDPEAIANALESLFVDKNLRKQMGLAARERIIRDYTLKQQTELFLTLYRGLSTS